MYTHKYGISEYNWAKKPTIYKKNLCNYKLFMYFCSRMYFILNNISLIKFTNYG